MRVTEAQAGEVGRLLLELELDEAFGLCVSEDPDLATPAGTLRVLMRDRLDPMMKVVVTRSGDRVVVVRPPRRQIPGQTSID
jgi:hypothetical protein